MKFTGLIKEVGRKWKENGWKAIDEVRIIQKNRSVGFTVREWVGLWTGILSRRIGDEEQSWKKENKRHAGLVVWTHTKTNAKQHEIKSHLKPVDKLKAVVKAVQSLNKTQWKLEPNLYFTKLCIFLMVEWTLGSEANCSSCSSTRHAFLFLFLYCAVFRRVCQWGIAEFFFKYFSQNQPMKVFFFVPIRSKKTVPK